MPDEKPIERPKRDLSILGAELGIQMNPAGSSTEQNKTDESGKNTETKISLSEDGSEVSVEHLPPKDPKTALADLDTDKKADEGKDDDKKFQLGGKYVAKDEVVKQLNEKFKNKYDFSKLDDETFTIYYDVLKEAKDGENKSQWQRSMGERENQIAAEKKRLVEDIKDFDEKAKELKLEKQKLTKLVNENVEDNIDLTEDERSDKKIDQKLAKRELEQIAREEKTLAEKSRQLEALQARLQFYEDHNALAKKFPELATSIHIKDVFAKKAAKQEVDKDDVRVAYAVFKIVNDAIDYGMDPVEFYEFYKDNYKLPVRNTSSTKSPADKKPAEKTAEELSAEEIDKRAKELKEKQEAAAGIPPGGKKVDPDPPQRGHVIPGKTEKQKMDFIISGGKTA